MENLNRKMATGAIWMILFKAVTKSLGLVSVVILARILSPEDFGLVALATAIIGALDLMSSFSFDVVLIQNQNATRKQYDTAWTITIFFAAVISLLLIALAGLSAEFYDDARLAPIMYVLAISVMAQGFQNIGVVAFRKEMEFHKEFIFMVSKKLIGFIVTISMAFWLRSYWALVAGIIAGKLGGTTMSYFVHPYRPRFSVAAWTELFRFSRWLFINNMLEFIRHRGGDFIIGKLLGAGALGLYTVSYEISHLPTSELVAPINRAVFPAYAKLANDLDKLRQSYLDVLAMIGIFAIPAAVGIAVLAELIVAVLLGPKWVEAGPLIRILGISGAIAAMETNIASVYLALKRPQILTRLFSFYVTLLIVLLLVFSRQWGMIGAAWAILAAALINLPVYYAAMFRTLKLKMPQFLAVIWRPVAGSAVMYGVLNYGLGLLTSSQLAIPSLISLLAAVMLGVLVYTVIVLLLWIVSGRPRGAESFALDRIKGLAGRR